MGESDRGELHDRLRTEPSSHSQVAHARAVASLPDTGAKEWAWQRFLGADPVSNYELEATGLGMWQGGQEQFTEPYVERFFDELPSRYRHFSGWVLADLAEWFFPVTSVNTATFLMAEQLVTRTDLDLSLRRRVIDQADDLRRRIEIQHTFGQL
jgi:aminopeptidase N